MNLVNLLRSMMIETMMFLLGLRLVLGQPKEEDMGRGKKQKRKGKLKEEVDDQLTVMDLIKNFNKPDKKPFENVKLPPPREIQSKPDNI